MLSTLGMIPQDETQIPWEILVPAWLMTNSMRMESLQYMQLLIQELHNVWRTSALGMLLDNSERNAARSPEFRLRRFVGQGQDTEMLCGAVQQFREIVDYVIPSEIPEPQKFVEVIQELVEEHGKFVMSDSDKSKVEEIQSVAMSISATSDTTNVSSKDSGACCA